MEPEIEQTLACLQQRRLNGFYADNVEQARERILALIPKEGIVGIGDSATLRQIGIVKDLMERGTKVLDAYKIEGISINPKESDEQHKRITREASMCDVFLAGTNAITQDGKIVNVDGVGNRVSGIVWGHPTSIVVVGKNKLVRDLDEAFGRIRTIIAPNHVRIRTLELGGRMRKTPCVHTGECDDCRSVDRICNVFGIIEGKPLYTDLNVIIINQDLGLGWDQNWPESRIIKIRENHKTFA